MTEHKVFGQHHQFNGHKFEELVMNRDSWCAAIDGVEKSWTRLSS